MSHTIKGFQEDQAVLLADKILAKTGESIHVDRVLRQIQNHGVVSEYTYWRKLPDVLDGLGFDYDEIEEVSP
ncbi:hypothetical protein SEA_DEJAVU_85 [Microbacterium Phage DejaVu]|nr:hypothetical protein LUPINE_84 [Microbacterium phage Lupine]QDK03328.1 hypothetical protein SEA_ROMAN_87 [Microbacterium phage Roman]WNM66217.1 hypothetical protein SEA_DEJAVU_85 [Microbacterium Phage DejaVu]